MANIMIVDDSKFMRKMLTDILIVAGHTIIGEAENPMEAIEFYKRLNPDLVTLDIVMPDVGGIDAVSALRAIIAEDSAARIVMVSSMGQQDVVDDFLNAGAKDFIVKPFQRMAVANAIKTALTAQ